MKPICTVLLITYNHAPYVRKCIDSVLSQKTKYPFIIKIFDDASTDGSSDIIRAYAKKYPKLIEAHIAEKNTGAQANIWQAYQSVDTKYCILTETDDYWCDDEKLQLQIDAMEKHPECSFCCTNNVVRCLQDKYLSFKDGKTEIAPGVYKSTIVSYEDIEKMPTHFLTHISTRLIRTACMELDKLKHKETFLFDATQYFYLITKGKMYWIDKICSVYVKTGTGSWSAVNAGKRMSVFLSAMAQLNEDLDGKIWKKIIQQITLVGNFWVNLDNKISGNITSALSVPTPAPAPATLPVYKQKCCLLGIPVFKIKGTAVKTKFYICGLSFFNYVHGNNKKKILFLDIPMLIIK